MKEMDAAQKAAAEAVMSVRRRGEPPGKFIEPNIDPSLSRQQRRLWERRTGRTHKGLNK